jgi:hypothetical protein
MSWLIIELRRIRVRPAMFLTDDRLNSLTCYLWGIFYGLELAGLRNTAEERFLKAFGRHLEESLDIDANGDWWFCLSTRQDPRGHVDQFFVELDRYLRKIGYPGGLDDESIELT